jgi:sigma-B regulation protein RsbU (phosphoserine phosphatase)
MIGMMPWPEFEVAEVPVPPGARLYVYSDGAHEIHKTDGTDWQFDEFVDYVAGLVTDRPDDVMDTLHRHIVEMHGSPVLDDDLTILEARFE